LVPELKIPKLIPWVDAAHLSSSTDAIGVNFAVKKPSVSPPHPAKRSINLGDSPLMSRFNFFDMILLSCLAGIIYRWILLLMLIDFEHASEHALHNASGTFGFDAPKSV
jgi:hypothetical protein